MMAIACGLNSHAIETLVVPAAVGEGEAAWEVLEAGEEDPQRGGPSTVFVLLVSGCLLYMPKGDIYYLSNNVILM